MKKKIALLLVLSVVVFSCITRLADTNKVVIGNDAYCIPKRHSLLDQTKGPLWSIPGADSGYGGSFQVVMEPDEVKKSIPAYLIYKDRYSVGMFSMNVRQAPPAGDIAWELRPQLYADILQLSGKYAKASVQVQYDEEHRFYRVNEFASSPFVLWDVLSVKPDTQAVVPKNLDDYYMASCSGESGVSSSCRYSVEILD